MASYWSISIKFNTVRSFMLQDLLACLKAKQDYYKTGHWQVKNTIYYADHLLLDRLASETGARIDQVAEKIIGVTGNAALLNLPDILKKQYEYIKDLPYNAPENTVIFQTGLQMEMKLQELCKVIDAAPESSLGVKTMVGDIANESEGRIYLLKQRLSKK